MAPQLVADRFLPSGPRRSGMALDLASGHRVLIRGSRHAAAGGQSEWAGRCEWLMEWWHPHVLPLLDFGEFEGRLCEVFLAPSQALRAPYGPRVADAVESALGYFQRHQRSVGTLDEQSLFLFDERIVLWPAGTTGVAMAGPDEAEPGPAENAWAADWARAGAFLKRLGHRRASHPHGSRGQGIEAPLPRALQSLSERLRDVLDTGESGRPRSCSLRIPGGCEATRAVWSLARQARLCGYVPVSVRLLGDITSPLDPGLIWPLLEQRHVCLFDEGCTGETAWLLVARLASASTRPHVLVRVESAANRAARSPAVAAHVAEQAACYQVLPGETERGRSSAAAPSAKREAEPACAAGDPETIRSRASLLTAAEAIGRGRHAAAERMLRHAVGALTRRMDASHAADAAMWLAHLQLSRGRTSEAASCFGQAQRLFEQARRACDALDAAAFVGVAWTDAGRFEEAEAALRGVRIAAEAAVLVEPKTLAVLGLARCLLWRNRAEEALNLLLAPGLAPDDAQQPMRLVRGNQGSGNVVREACPAPLALEPAAVLPTWRMDEGVVRSSLCARAAMAVEQPALAFRHAIEAHRRALEGGRPLEVATACTPLALAYGLVGDLDAARRAVHEGMVAARAAHAPLRSLRLRLALAEVLRNCKCDVEADRLVGRLSRIDRACLPVVLRLPLERLVEGRAMPRVVPGFRHAVAETLVEVLAACQGPDDEREQARAGLAVVCRRLRAVSVALYGAVERQPLLLVEQGAGRPCAESVRRCLETGQPVSPCQSASGLDAAVPVRCSGSIIGVLYSRWPADIDPGWVETSGVLNTVAVALAPVTRTLIERRAVPVRRDAESVPELIGNSEAMSLLRQHVIRLANAPFNVLIEGESGSGKELVAHALHRLGPRRHRHFCAVNCAALTDELLETELFGHARGAFTGAVAERRGLFEEADGGTLLLDEVGELSARAQAKLLRAIQEGEVRRVGENHTRAVDVRLIAATNRALVSAVAAGAFRQDLLYRLAVTRLVVPPLRERAEDIPSLAMHFWRQATERLGSRATLSASSVASLTGYDWPGNVRELQNVMAALAVAAGRRGRVGPDLLPGCIAGAATSREATSLEEARRLFEARYVKAALARAGGRRGQAARDLGLSRQGFAKLLARLEIEAELETV